MKKKDIENIIQVCYENSLNREGNQLAKFLDDTAEIQLAVEQIKVELELYQGFLKAGHTRPKVLEQVHVSSTELLKTIDTLNLLEI